MTETITIKQTGPKTEFGAPYAAFDSKDNLLKDWFCSNHSWALIDLGPRQKEFYNELFPEGWRIVFEWEQE